MWTPFERRWKTFMEATAIEKTVYSLGGIVVGFVALLVLSLLLALFGDSGSMANTVAIIRDLFIILLAMQGMLIGLALTLLIIRLAEAIAFLQHELSPLLKTLQDTATTLKGTGDFLNEQLTGPVAESRALLGSLGLLWAKMRANPKTKEAEKE
jgi:uncharacterized membrane protein